MEEQHHRKKPPKPPAKPQPAGVTALDTGFCYLSLLYPFRINRDIYRDIFIFKEVEGGSTVLERLHYSEIPGKYKAQIKECEQKQAFSFVLLCIALVEMRTHAKRSGGAGPRRTVGLLAPLGARFRRRSIE